MLNSNFCEDALEFYGALISRLLDGTVDPNKVDCMIVYVTILKPGVNVVALYKLVAPFKVPITLCSDSQH